MPNEIMYLFLRVLGEVAPSWPFFLRLIARSEKAGEREKK